ncbi:MAG: hypothetical protein HY777_12945 [Betaproteobacteria bacterium]|nr:hypothetical protein [Betaproteobacteria bacterium]
MKYLLLIVLVGVVGWLWRKSRAPEPGVPPAVPPDNGAEDMVKCALCGVNQPVSDSILAGGHYYCCSAHRRAARPEDR